LKDHSPPLARLIDDGDNYRKDCDDVREEKDDDDDDSRVSAIARCP